MKKRLILWSVLLYVFAMTGCAENALAGDCKCTVTVEDMPRELMMLDENVLEQFYIRISMENIYTEEDIDVRLCAENQFQAELKLQPGTYRISDCYASSSYLVPIEVESMQEKLELTRDDPMTVDIQITNRDEFVEWAWNCEANREILQADAFSHKIQLDGQVIELEQIKDYVEFDYKEKVSGFAKVTLNNTKKGISMVLQNTDEDAVEWKDCKLLEIHFTKNNVIWGQGAHVGMDVSEAVHASQGLYGKPDSMSGTILAGVGYDRTYVNWSDPKSGDKLTLELSSDGDYISEIIYCLEVFE